MAGRDPLLLERAARVRLLALDVDGVLTDGRLYFEAHQPLEEDATSPSERLDAIFAAYRATTGNEFNAHLEDHVRTLAETPRGIALQVAMYDADEVLARVRVVENIVVDDVDMPGATGVGALIDTVSAEPESL